MKIELEINDADIQAQVIEKLVNRLHFDAQNVTSAMVKEVILGEVRTAVKEHTAELLKTMTLSDGRSIKQYVVDRLGGMRTAGMSGRERTRVEETIDRTISDNAHAWYNEFFAPRMAEIKVRIKDELLSKILRESI